ncbi:MAG: pilus assembly protein PilM [Candidatus Omnitrophota bacterium]|jgi:type IV pilus assembly protein PilM
MIQLFNNIIKRKDESFVAINLGNRYLKGLVVKDGKVSDFFLRPRENIAEDLKAIWQEKKISTNRVKISLKDHSSLVRYFSFPKLDKKKLKQTLFYELNKHIPFSPEEVYFDFSILEEISANEVFLLLAVAKKELINSTIDIFEKEKKDIVNISLDSICLINTFLGFYKEEKKMNTATIDIGYNFSTLTIFKKGIPFMTRDLTFGAKDILSVLSNVKKIPVGDIDAWVANSANHKEFLELSQNNIASLSREAKSSFDYFEMNKGERIEKLFLTGGLAQVKGISEIFADYLDAEVALLDNLEGLSAINDSKFNDIKNNLAVASGLML